MNFKKNFEFQTKRSCSQNTRIQNDAIENVALPFVYALLSLKETIQYESVFQAVTTAAEEYNIQNCQPRKILGDFELSIVNACRRNHPTAIYTGCFFHFTQNVYRHIQGSGLQANYADPTEREIKKYSHMLMALAYVPIQDVQRVFRLLKNDDEIPETLSPVVKYIEETYVLGVPRRGNRRAVPPRYPIPLWNQYEASINGEQKTNNCSEGWHNRFRLIVGKHHPDLYSFLTEIQKEQADTEIAITELSLGRVVKSALKKKNKTSVIF